MAKSFYLGSRLRRYAYANQFGAESEHLKTAIVELMNVSDAVVGSNIKGTIVSDVYHFLENTEENDGESADQEDEGDVIHQIKSPLTNTNIGTIESGTKLFNRIKYQGFILSTASFSESNSNVYLRQWQGTVCSQQLFQVQQIRQTGNNINLCLKKYAEPTNNTADIYSEYPLLRAKIWSKTLDPEEINVQPSDIRCHAALWNFSHDQFVAVVLDRVSFVTLYPTVD